MKTDNMTNLKDKIIKEFTEFEKSNSGFKEIRKEAINKFNELGFPTRKNEEWRYTHISPIIKHNYSALENPKGKDITKPEIEKLLIPGLEANLLVVIDGKFSVKFSGIKEKNSKIILNGFHEALNNDLVQKSFSKNADYTTDALTALNTAFANDGVYINIPDNTVPEFPVVILNITGNDVFAQPRLHITVGNNSELTLIELSHNSGNNGLTNSVTEIFAGENSNVSHYKIQNENETSFHIANLQVSQTANSKYNSFIASWGGKILRNNTCSTLAGEHSECRFNGIYIVKGDQVVDNHTLVDHAVPNCFSNELYKGVLDDSGVGVFNGKVFVRKDAQKTNAYQSNKNIVLSDTATINAKPQLEIFADDVKCSHGATTGQLNEEELFYLRTRGIGEYNAKKLLLYAFISEVIDEVKIEPLKNYLDKLLHEKL